MDNSKVLIFSFILSTKTHVIGKNALLDGFQTILKKMKKQPLDIQMENYKITQFFNSTQILSRILKFCVQARFNKFGLKS